MKDKKWLTNEIEIMESETSENYPHEQMVEREVVLNLIDQLDEPETLSEYWIEQKSIDTHVDTLNGEIQVTFRLDDLENLIIPKQEKVKIPYFIEEHIQTSLNYSEENTVVGKIENHMLPRIDETETDSRVLKFFNVTENIDLVALAMITENYEVEEEQSYYVIFPSVDENGKGFNYLAKDCYHKELWVEDVRTDGLVWEERSSFTEDEIRDLDKGDILFEHFAVKVEELEE